MLPHPSPHTLCTELRRPGSIVCRLPGDSSHPRFGLFSNPHRILRAMTVDEVAPLFAELETWISTGGYAAGYVGYEAGQAFEPLLHQFAPGTDPMALFALYREPPLPVEPSPAEHPGFNTGFSPEMTETAYVSSVERIRAAIKAGELYQANFTFRSFAEKTEKPEALFLRLLTSHPAPYAAFVRLDDTPVISLSPELFFETAANGCICGSPMKGTARRQPEAAADRAAAEALSHDPKNCAENLMIVDMVRNDFGRVCQPGSISVDPLLHVDTYRTVHQMISTVHGRLAPDWTFYQLFAAAFPPASITGAPKISAVAHIHASEISPRGLYTGSIGCLFPDRSSCFNVAIRTLLCRADRTELGIGGGITYDSDPHDEWQEALLKSRFATTATLPDFEIFETLPWHPAQGYGELPQHLARATQSQNYFGRRFDRTALLRQLAELDNEIRHAPALQHGACIKFIVKEDGSATVNATPPRCPDWRGLLLRLLVSRKPTDASSVFVYHKTTCRDFYDREHARARQAGFHDMIFFNRDGWLTEGAISSIFLKLDRQWKTPALHCGLLPGIWRQQKLRELHAVEACLTAHDLRNAEQIIIGNSLRGQGDVAAIEWETPESDAYPHQRQTP